MQTMNLTQALHKALRESPHANAVVCGEQRSTFTQFVGRCAQLAGVLRQLGVQRGDRVVMMSIILICFVF